MFQLLTIEDTVILEPQELSSVKESVEARLDVRYLNKVIMGEGPCLLIKNVQLLDKIII
jgi:DNA-directed RNA polymerase subunit E'/Rpb7